MGQSRKSILCIWSKEQYDQKYKEMASSGNYEEAGGTRVNVYVCLATEMGGGGNVAENEARISRLGPDYEALT